MRSIFAQSEHFVFPVFQGNLRQTVRRLGLKGGGYGIAPRNVGTPVRGTRRTIVHPLGQQPRVRGAGSQALVGGLYIEPGSLWENAYGSRATGGSETSCSSGKNSPACWRRRSSWRSIANTTTIDDRTALWVTGLLRSSLCPAYRSP
jgi:hypothetical protein